MNPLAAAKIKQFFIESNRVIFHFSLMSNPELASKSVVEAGMNELMMKHSRATSYQAEVFATTEGPILAIIVNGNVNMDAATKFM